MILKQKSDELNYNRIINGFEFASVYSFHWFK